MTELQQNRYDKLLRRVGNLIGAKSMVNDALGELFPMLEVETLHAELLLLSDWKMAHGAIAQQPGALEIAKTQLFNPAESGSLVVPTRVSIRSATTAAIRYLFQSVVLDEDLANRELFDSRLGFPTRPLAQLRSEETVGGVASFGEIFVLADVSYIFDIPFGMCVIAPGTGLTFSHTAVNVDMTTDWHWRERAAQQSELQF